MRARQPLIVAAVTFLLGGLVLLGAPSALAHTVLLTAVPANGATLTASPSQIVLTYDEPVQASTLQMAVTASSGATVSQDKPSVVGTVVTQPLPPDLPNDTYTLAYRLVSVDGHPVSNAITFTVKNPASSASPVPSPSPSPTSSHSGSSSTKRDPARLVGGLTVFVIAVAIVALNRRRVRRAKP
jgi:methionine-rich copper-binding protein CopC